MVDYCYAVACYRFDRVVRNFDETISEILTDELQHSGVHLHQKTQVTRLRALIMAPT